VGNLILGTSCEFHFDDVTVTSVVNIIGAARNSNLLFVCWWAKGLIANAIHTEINATDEGKCFTTPAIPYMFGVRSLLIAEKVFMNNNLPMEPATSHQHRFSSSIHEMLIVGLNA